MPDPIVTSKAQPNAASVRHDPPATGETAGDALEALIRLMQILRSPGGCPWDREQTLETLKPFVLEEAHEVVEAIERKDMRELEGEIGDFMFEGVFLAELCAEAGDFTLTDALRHVHAKLVRRHPHIFAETSGIETVGAVKGQWEVIKAQEREAVGKPRKGMFDGIPKALPALLAAFEIGNRAAATGFDWHQAADVVDKIEEEAGELRETLASGNRAAMEEELGDLLFAVANLARKLQIEPEAALRAANRKFTSRFTALQSTVHEQGQTLKDLSLDEMEAIWRQVKAAEPHRHNP